MPLFDIKVLKEVINLLRFLFRGMKKALAIVLCTFYTVVQHLYIGSTDKYNCEKFAHVKIITEISDFV